MGKRLPSESAAAAFQYVTDARASRHDRDARDSAAAAAATAAEAAGTHRRDGQCEWRFSVNVVVVVVSVSLSCQYCYDDNIIIRNR